jgi:glycerol transport system ATP-binding protein
MNQGLELSGVARVVNAEMHLSDISMTFGAGTFTTLLGATRAGKTSLLRLLAGLDHPSVGTLSWNGVDVTRADVQTRDVAMVYQQFVNYPSLTVYDNIASPLRAKKRVAREEIDRRVREAASLLRIDKLLDRLPVQLSGGQQQRTALARALVKRAGLVLLDEPLANLDYKLREELRSELRALFRNTPAIVVYATAEPSEALLLGGRTAVLHEGRVLQCGSAIELYRAPANELVGQIFSDPRMNLLPAELSAAGELTLGAQLRFAAPPMFVRLAAGSYRLGVRAHRVRLAAAGEHDWRIPATLRSLEVSGSATLLHAHAGELAISAQVVGVHRLELGAALDLYISPAHVFVFDSAAKLVAAASDERTHSAADIESSPRERHGGA